MTINCIYCINYKKKSFIMKMIIIKIIILMIMIIIKYIIIMIMIVIMKAII